MLGYSNKYSEADLANGQRHLWKHFEDFLVDMKDSTRVHLIFQFSSQGSIFLGGEQKGWGIATP